MQLLSDDEATRWCEDCGFRAGGPLASMRIDFPGGSAKSLRIPIADDAIAIVSLAYMLMLTNVPEYEEGNFPGALVWLQRWEIWSESIDRAGYVLLDSIRLASGCTGELSAAPAQVFTTSEFAKAHASLSLPMLFQWDAHFVPATGAFFAFISHEGHMDIIARDEQVYAAMLQRFHDWSPTEVAPSQRGVN